MPNFTAASFSRNRVSKLSVPSTIRSTSAQSEAMLFGPTSATIGMAFGPEAGLRAVDELLEEKALKSYHLLPAVRGDMLAKLGRHEEARGEFARAAALTENLRERKLLLERAAKQ